MDYDKSNKIVFKITNLFFMKILTTKIEFLKIKKQ